MSAGNIIIEPDRALVWTDSAVFNMAGEIIGHHRKTIPIESMKAVVSVCGIPFIAEFLAMELAHLAAEIGTTFDDIMASDGALVDEVFTAVAPFAPTLGTLPRRFWLTGWSEKSSAPGCLQFSSMADCVPMYSLGWSTISGISYQRALIRTDAPSLACRWR